MGAASVMAGDSARSMGVCVDARSTFSARAVEKFAIAQNSLGKYLLNMPRDRMKPSEPPSFTLPSTIF